MKSLHVKLTLALLVLLALAGSAFLGLSLWTTRTYLQEVNQKLHVDVAQHLVDEVLLIEKGEVNEEGLEHIFHMMMVINPGIEIYLLDAAGKILAYSAPAGKVKAEQIPLEPIRLFLDAPPRLPFTAEDPRQPGAERVFSAARIGPEARPAGYLYVVLGGERYTSAVELLAASHILRLSSIGLGIILLFVALGGGLAFALLTRRLRRLRRSMASFEESRFTTIEPTGAPRVWMDEIDDLARTFERLGDEMSSQLGKARSADDLRRELVANVSHDLRTPLASLTAFIETLIVKDAELSPEDRRRYLAVALRHSQSLGELVARLFELAKLEARQTEAHPEPFAPGELLMDVAQKFEIRAREAGVTLRLDVPDDIPFVNADLSLIERVLDNLIENALRHAKGGRVTLAVRANGTGARLTVADTGVGIPEQDLPFVFDRYYRAEALPEDARAHAERTPPPDRRRAGLGLAIAQHIAQLHGSRIEVDSKTGVGTAFHFDLGYRPAMT